MCKYRLLLLVSLFGVFNYAATHELQFDVLTNIVKQGSIDAIVSDASDTDLSDGLALTQHSPNHQYPNGITFTVTFQANCDATLTAAVTNQSRPSGVTSPWGWSVSNPQNNSYDYSADKADTKNATFKLEYYYVKTQFTASHKGDYSATLEFTLTADE
ncbi:hypothetical protein N9N03_00495 [Chlamydiia bacterium]|nr:hypothetical protein [Chlamydiia bacterium]